MPMSGEMRKLLWRWLQGQSEASPAALVFATRDGKKLGQRNMLRHFKVLGTRLRITRVRFSFHTMRHTFAVNYIRAGERIAVALVGQLELALIAFEDLIAGLAGNLSGKMRPLRSGQITELLQSWNDGDQSAIEKLMPLVYDELHRLAQQHMSRERTGTHCKPRRC